MHPYEMQQTFRLRFTDRVVKIKAGSLYHTVERLEKIGLIEIAETSRSGRRPERTIYQLTDTGRAVYSDQVTELLSTVAEEYPSFPLALTLGDDLGKDEMLGSLRIRQEELELLLASEKHSIERVMAMPLPDRYWLDLRYTLAIRTAELEFVKKLIADIESGKVPWQGDEKAYF